MYKEIISWAPKIEFRWTLYIWYIVWFFQTNSIVSRPKAITIKLYTIMAAAPPPPPPLLPLLPLLVLCWGYHQNWGQLCHWQFRVSVKHMICNVNTPTITQTSVLSLFFTPINLTKELHKHLHARIQHQIWVTEDTMYSAGHYNSPKCDVLCNLVGNYAW